MQHHILIVEDDKKISVLLKRFFVEKNYLVSSAITIKECEEFLKYFIFDLIILDVMLPGESGASFIKRYKKNNSVPVIMLSALGEVDDKINALESGAEDYITKPFDPRELLVRVKNLISRNDNPYSESAEFGEFKFNMQNGNLFKGEELIHLTTNEKDLLSILIKNSGNIISRDELLNHFPTLNERSIDAQVSRLRSKIEKDPKHPFNLQTVRGKGYVLWK